MVIAAVVPFATRRSAIATVWHVDNWGLLVIVSETPTFRIHQLAENSTCGPLRVMRAASPRGSAPRRKSRRSAF
jgi:hypothetical protein